jgi:RNA-directed DNA polymerase
MIDKTQSKKVEIPEACLEGSERNSRGTGTGASRKITAKRANSSPEEMQLMEWVVERENMKKALKRVEENKGASGVDEMPVAELREYLKAEWPRIKEELLSGRYKPEAVREVEIPKPGGKGMRTLGIPTVLDRLIQQAVHQVLSPIFDPEFSESSYGFRPGRSAHQAVAKARQYVASGKRWVVDMDLEKFFDRVNQDVLMARVARKVTDKRVLLLIRRFLQAGIMKEGVTQVRREGTPQGGPLSPLLSNILLDDLDKELESRGHCFCRYADDCNIYVGSKQSGERVMKSVTEFLASRLRLKVNQEKSAVDRPWERKFLGYSMTAERNPRLKVAVESLKRLRGKLKEIFRKGRGRNLERFIKEELNPLLKGWINYFRHAEVKLIFEELDSWIRRKLRCIIWRQLKRTYTRARKLMSRGIQEQRAFESAANGRGPWWNSGASHMNEAFKKSYFDRMKLVSLLNELRKLQFTLRTAVYGTVRTVV